MQPSPSIFLHICREKKKFYTNFIRLLLCPSGSDKAGGVLLRADLAADGEKLGRGGRKREGRRLQPDTTSGTLNDYWDIFLKQNST